MHYGIDREGALLLLREHVRNENLIKHCIATEAVMAALAERLNEDPQKWGLAGLLHDLDVEEVGTDLTRHTIATEKILREKGVDKDIVLAVKMHNETAHGMKRSEKFHHALAAGETITGLITATALVYTDKKLSSVKAKSIKKRMKEKGFAAGVNRETIMECERLGLSLDEFAQISLEAMQKVAQDLGL